MRTEAKIRFQNNQFDYIFHFLNIYNILTFEVPTGLYIIPRKLCAQCITLDHKRNISHKLMCIKISTPKVTVVTILVVYV